MKNRWIVAIIFLLLAVVVIVGISLNSASNNGAIDIQTVSTNSRPDCLKNAEDTCLVIPSVTGLDADSAEISFPEQFESDYHLVVMPFDRDQQVLASLWLPLFQEIVSENDNLQYWSIAALPELNGVFRTIIMAGLSAGIFDDEVRPQTTVLFLTEQEVFLEALALENDEILQVFITDNEGVIYYRGAGEFTVEGGDALREALNEILPVAE